MDRTRFSGIFNASNLNVLLVGAGGIGSPTALTLAKMGVGNITIVDGDVVAPENLGPQLHRPGTEGEPKVEALDKTLRLFVDDVNIWPVDGLVTDADDYGGLSGYIVISAVDSIAARKAIWKQVKLGNNRWYLDARMAAEVFHLYAVNMRGDYSWYDQMIAAEDDSRIEDIACTEKATFYCGMEAAARIGVTVRKILTKRPIAKYVVVNLIDDEFMAMGQA